MAEDTSDIFNINQLWNCEHAFERRCPKRWESLAPTGNKAVRYSDQCNEPVTLCHTPEEFVRLGNAGRCVAIPDRLTPLTMTMAMLGRPSTEEVKKLESQQATCAQWWLDTLALNPSFAPIAMAAIANTIHHTKG